MTQGALLGHAGARERPVFQHRIVDRGPEFRVSLEEADVVSVADLGGVDEIPGEVPFEEALEDRLVAQRIAGHLVIRRQGSGELDHSRIQKGRAEFQAL